VVRCDLGCRLRERGGEGGKEGGRVRGIHPQRRGGVRRVLLVRIQGVDIG